MSTIFNKKSDYITFILFILAFLSFMLIPFTGDIRVYMAGAKQGEFLNGNLFYNAFNSWDTRGALNRLLFSFCHYIASNFSVYGSFIYEIIIKLIYSIIIIATSFISTNLIFYNKNKSYRFIISCVISTLFFCNHLSGIMQSEMSNAICFVLAFSLAYSAIVFEKKYILKLIISGIFISFMFFFKAVLIVLSIMIVAGIFLLLPKLEVKKLLSKIILLIVISFISLGLILLFVLLHNKNDFRDVIDMAIFQNTVISTNFHIGQNEKSKFIYSFHSSLIAFPYIYIGIMISLINIFIDLKNKRNLIFIFYHFIIWSAPCFTIFFSNKYTLYHFISFLPAVYIEMIYLLKKNDLNITININCIFITILISCLLYALYFILQFPDELGLQITNFLLAICIIFLFLYLVSGKKYYLIFKYTICFCFAIYLTFISGFSFNSISQLRYCYKAASLKPNLPIDSVCLYMDSGQGAYYVGRKSALKYFLPLPIQRFGDDSQYSNLECRRYCIDNIYKFNYDYVTYDSSWLKREDLNSIKNDILAKYEECGSVKWYGAVWDLFNANKITGIVELPLYKKKE